MKRFLQHTSTSLVSIVFVFLVTVLFLGIQTFNDYKLKTNLTVFQEREMHSTVDNFINTIDFMRKETIAYLEASGVEYTEKNVKDATLNFARQVVHNTNYANGAYIWINEVVNYDGGDNYAIRQVHGNLPETEGMSLSTSMQDAKGNYPYLEELNGIKAHGELTYKYYFKEYKSDVESQKITYAKLYKPYNWIVCTGTYLNSMYDPAGGVSQKTNLTYTIFCSLLIVLSLTIFFYIIITNHLSSRKLIMETEYLKEEVATDSLTGAGSRAFGESVLSEYLNNFHTKGINYTIAVLDIDKFKSINDSYGHYVGDIVLKNLVSTVKSQITSKDHIIRWGGDEFIIIYHKLEDELDSLLDKLNKSISEQIITIESGTKITYTISVGACHLTHKDKNQLDCVKRADKALYQAKKTKNTYYVVV